MSTSARPRKRDLVRAFLGKRDPLLPIRAPVIPVPSPVQPTQTVPADPASVPLGQRFLDAALQKLTTDEQATIREHMTSTARNIDQAIDEASAAALKQKRVCEDKQWKWTINGRVIVLRDQADKLVRLLDSFKSIGDSAASIDAIHIGLPWAGIRLLLNFAASDSKQMAALLAGMDLALFTASRLQAYFGFFQRLPSVPTTENFKEALTKLYVHVLRFLATAIRTYQRNAISRILRGAWETSTLDTFQTDCDRLTLIVAGDADSCDRELSASDRETMSLWKEDLARKLQTLDRIETIRVSLAAMHVKVDLAKLVTAKGAIYDAHTNEHLAKCLEGTRTDLLQQITKWSDDLSDDSRRIFWLCGKAGTGKSTVACTVAAALENRQYLGASFFFKRGEADRDNAGRLFPTIALQLANVIPGLGHSIAQALEADSMLCERSLHKQFDKLLLQPLHIAAKPFPHLVIVIDALDECGNEHHVRHVLSLLSQLEIRIFVTSRPESDIRLFFRDIDATLHHDVHLEEIQSTTIEHDIRLYFKHCFHEIRKRDAVDHPIDPLPDNWPGEDEVDALVNLAVPLFIFATTVCRLISKRDPERHLQLILQQRNNALLTGLDKIYVPILQQMLINLGSDEESMMDFRRVVGPIVMLADPLSVKAISVLLDIPLRTIQDVLKHLHSVLHIPSTASAPVRFLHLSFRDFLVGGSKEKNKFHLDESQTHAILATQCLRRLSKQGGLHKDLCSFNDPGVRRKDVSKARINIPTDLAYACQYWPLHVIESKHVLDDNGEVHRFLQSHLLSWLEALSWLGRLSDAANAVSQLQSIVQVDQGPHLLAFLDDARRYIMRNRYIIDTAPLQVYYSALFFAPTRSLVKDKFNCDVSQILAISPGLPRSWGPETQTLEGHDREILAVTFLPGSKVLASVSSDQTIKFWNAWTGEKLRELDMDSDEEVYSATISRDGRIIAVGIEDGEILLIDAQTGSGIQRFNKYSGTVLSIALSSDGKFCASYSAVSSRSILIWDTSRAAMIQEIETSDLFVSALAFCPDGRTIAATICSDSGSIVQLWNPQTGRKSFTLERNDYNRTQIAFLPLGKEVAVGSADYAVRVWNFQSDNQLQRFQGHGTEITALAFSPDGKLLASSSADHTIRLLEIKTGVETHVFKGHWQTITSIAFSEDGDVMASGSNDCTLRLWNVSTVAKSEDTDRVEPQEVTEFANMITCVDFSPDGVLVASCSTSIQLWDAHTGAQVRAFGNHEKYSWINLVLFSPLGNVLASSSNHMIKLWDPQTGEQTRELKGHEDHIGSIIFSPDGKSLVSTGEDQAVRIWNTETGQLLQRLTTYSNTVVVVSFFAREIAAISPETRSIEIYNAWNRRDMRDSSRHSTMAIVINHDADDSNENPIEMLLDAQSKERVVPSKMVHITYKMAHPLSRFPEIQEIRTISTDDDLTSLKYPAVGAKLKIDKPWLTRSKDQWIQRQGQVYSGYLVNIEGHGTRMAIPSLSATVWGPCICFETTTVLKIIKLGLGLSFTERQYSAVSLTKYTYKPHNFFH